MSLTREEMFERNLKISKERLVQEIETPEAFAWIPDRARIINLPKDAPDLLQANLDLALQLAEEDDRPLILLPEPGFDIPWESLAPLITGKRIANVVSSQHGAGLEFVFDDGTHLTLFAIQRADDPEGRKQPILSISFQKEAAA